MATTINPATLRNNASGSQTLQNGTTQLNTKNVIISQATTTKEIETSEETRIYFIKSGHYF